MDEHRLRRLLDAGRSLISELDPGAVLQWLVEVARGVTGVRFAALGVLEHAGATRVEIRVTDDDDDLEIALRDDGAGFEPDAATSGFGLVGMRERVALVHGNLEVVSAPGEGTTIRARIPSRRRTSAAPAQIA